MREEGLFAGNQQLATDATHRVKLERSKKDGDDDFYHFYDDFDDDFICETHQSVSSLKDEE